MKFLLPTLVLVAGVSLPAFAQEAPAPDAAMRPPADTAMARPSAQQMEAMQKVREQMRQIHTNARLQMLGSLTPAHRAALANIIGQLAIAPNPNRKAAEAQIDALLSNSEKSSVLNAEASARTNSRSLMESARTQFEATLSADDRAKMQARDAARQQRMAQGQTRGREFGAETPDAGRSLLRVSSAGGGLEGGPGEGGRGGDFMRGMHGGPPPGAPAN